MLFSFISFVLLRSKLYRVWKEPCQRSKVFTGLLRRNKSYLYLYTCVHVNPLSSPFSKSKWPLSLKNAFNVLLKAKLDMYFKSFHKDIFDTVLLCLIYLDLKWHCYSATYILSVYLCPRMTYSSVNFVDAILFYFFILFMFLSIKNLHYFYLFILVVDY